MFWEIVGGILVAWILIQFVIPALILFISSVPKLISSIPRRLRDVWRWIFP